MTQESISVSTTPPLPGLAMVQQVNSALETIATDFAGPDDPAALAGPYMTWADTASGVLKRRNAAGSAWIPIAPLLEETPSAALARWYGKAIGEPFFLWDHISGVAVPPTSVAGLRFVKLTASDAYNTGVLTGESVSGSAPLVLATAIVSLPGSPINGATISLINTERRALRAGSSGTGQDDALQNIVGQVGYGISTGSSATGDGPFTTENVQTGVFASGSSGNAYRLRFNASLAVRTATETRMRNIGATAYVRIL